MKIRKGKTGRLGLILS